MTVVNLRRGDQVVSHTDIDHWNGRRVPRGTPGTVVDVGLTGVFVEFGIPRKFGPPRLCRMWVGRGEVNPV